MVRYYLVSGRHRSYQLQHIPSECIPESGGQCSLDDSRYLARGYATHPSRSSGCDFIFKWSDYMDVEMKMDALPEGFEPVKKERPKLVRRPVVPKQDYIPLTDDEIESCRKGQDIFDFARDIETIIKEKNKL
jgi:hypothetical protein